jgi:hypothetical protein
MRFACLFILILAAPGLAALSYGPRPWDRCDVVGDGRFEYVQLDHVARNLGEKPWRAVNYTKDGLYERGRPDRPIWYGSLRLRFHGDMPPIVSHDGRMAAVLRGRNVPRVDFFINGRFLRSWELSGPSKPPLRSRTALYDVPFMHWNEHRGVISVSSRTGDDYTFLLRDGLLARRRAAAAQYPSAAEMEAFERALDGHR